MPDFTKDDRLYKNVCFKLIEIHGVLFLLSYSSEVNGVRHKLIHAPDQH